MEINREILQDYADITAQIKNLEERKEKLAEALLSYMSTEGIEKVQDEMGTFSLVRTKRYEYSADMKALEEYVKECKEDEKTTGAATAKESLSMRFQAPKE